MAENSGKNKEGKSNDKALDAFCEVLLALQNMQDSENLKKPKSELSEKNAVTNRIIALTIRQATHSAHPFGYSDGGKRVAQFISETALSQLECNGDSDNLICEHIIPISVLTKRITDNWSEWSSSNDNLKRCFKEYSATAIITVEEDKLFNKANKLRSNITAVRLKAEQI
ncbi:MAG: hypothetical protein FD134_518 [Gallionellaceae bacterium]|nr:MAG: hypothetical protein FD134_518 [Gallionellaceae bacterium]